MAVEQILILEPSGDGGCVPHDLDWKPKKQGLVAILNTTKSEQRLWDLVPNMLFDPGSTTSLEEIHIPAGGYWYGNVVKKGRYDYDNGKDVQATRTGRINPS